MGAIFGLSLRMLIRRRRFLAVVALAAVPLVLALVFVLSRDPGKPSALEFLDSVTSLTITIVLPLAVLLLATAAFGDEVDDRTLVYLVLKPIPRWTIAAPKFAAAFLVSGALVGGTAVVSAVAIAHDAGEAAALLAGVLVGAAGYAALFTWGGLAIRNALAVGLVYVFLWEASLSGLFSGIRFLSIRQYALGTVHGIDASQLARSNIELGLSQALVGLVVVLALFGWLTVRRLRLMDVP